MTGGNHAGQTLGDPRRSQASPGARQHEHGGATLIDANGAVKTTTFDAAGRAVSMLYADRKRVTLQYDALGRRTTMIDRGRTTTYGYAVRGELTGKTEPTALRMTMLYDSLGNRTTLTEPDGYSYTFGYDAANRPIRLRNPNAYVYTCQYDAGGRRSRRSGANRRVAITAQRRPAVAGIAGERVDSAAPNRLYCRD